MTLLRIFEIMQWARDARALRFELNLLYSSVDRSIAKISTENNAAARIAQKTNQDNNEREKNELPRKMKPNENWQSHKIALYEDEINGVKSARARCR